jgi:hypothetical protein
MHPLPPYAQMIATGKRGKRAHTVPSTPSPIPSPPYAQMIATGKRHAAAVSNSASVEASAVASGLRSGDLVCPLPYAPEFYRKEFASKVGFKPWPLEWGGVAAGESGPDKPEISIKEFTFKVGLMPARLKGSVPPPHTPYPPCPPARPPHVH